MTIGIAELLIYTIVCVVFGYKWAPRLIRK